MIFLRGYKMLRGGSWDYYPGRCRSAARNSVQPACAYYLFGFRVCCLSVKQ
jgi:formylglycine-generating enzyme required for sulfatase activity